MSGTFPRVALKRVAQIQYGLGQPPPLVDAGVPILRATNIERGRIVSKGLVFAAAHDLPIEQTPLLRAGEVLVVRSGAYTGDSALVTPEWAGASPGYDLRLTPHSTLESRFLAYSMLGRLAAHTIDIAKGRAAQPHLNAEDLGTAPIFLPRLDQQRRIADFLDVETARIQALITAKQKMIELGSARHLRWFSQLLDMGLGSSSFATGCPLRFVAHVTGGLTVGKAYPGETRKLPYLRVANVQDGYLDLSDVAQIAVPASEVDRFALRSGDLLVLEGNGNPQNLGRGCIWRAEIPGTVLHQNHVHVVRPGTRLLPEFLALVLRTEAARNYFTGGSNQVSIATLSQERLGGLRMPLPSVSEQRRLVDEVELEADRVDRLRVSLANQIELLRERREALITAAVMGELEI